jgi:hypothetical protein
MMQSEPARAAAGPSASGINKPSTKYRISRKAKTPEMRDLANMDDLEQLLANKKARDEADAAMRVRVHKEMSKRMDTGIRVNPALAAMWANAPAPAPLEEGESAQ